MNARFFAIILFFFSTFSFAQKLNYKAGELLVKCNKEILLKAISNEFDKVNFKRTVSNSAQIHLISYPISLKDDLVIEYLYRIPGVQVVQRNHIVKHRTTLSSDTSFNNQWHLSNDGSNSGLFDADLDIEEAWDLTTGGTTLSGDTIVVCIIDDGIDTTHLDFGDNIWVNKAEIPNNGLDDDGNGYIDDYKGWDILSDSDSIGGGSHGTPIIGVIGAKGNNTTGISGINWNVKLMIVKNDFDTDEASVIEAYEYPLKMRKLYNQTNGVKGAYVVATNSSWGLDNGKPSDAPLWCSIYDSLGKYGILNVASTTNNNTDVDVNGDLPTGCESNYLISVTSLDNADVKLNAGYGAVSVDLGSYGQNVYSTKAGNSYGATTGTSIACPMVSGTVGLIYALNCNDFAQRAKNDPSGTALLVKNAILSSSEFNSSLNGITVTDGRLNTFESLKYIQNICDSSICAIPYGLEVINQSNSKALLKWEGIYDTNYVVSFKTSDDAIWSYDTVQSKSLLKIKLASCSKYEFKVKTICDTGWTDFSSSLEFKTSGCGNCLSFEYCDAYANSSALTWIDSVAVDSFYNQSGSNGGYGDFLVSGVKLFKDSILPFHIQPGFSGSELKNFYKVWVDFNQNNTFDSTEIVFQNLLGDSLPISGFIKVDSMAVLGSTRMRIMMQAFNDIDTSCGSITFGEVEDYCVEILKKPIPIDTNGITEIQKPKIIFYPNPFENSFSFRLEKSQKAKIVIKDITGKAVYTNSFISKENNIILNENINKGLYFVEIHLENSIFVEKLIKL